MAQHPLFLLIAAATLWAASGAHAQNSKFAHCDEADRELREAGESMGKAQRLVALEQLAGDLSTLIKEYRLLSAGLSSYPRSFLHTCQKRKEKVLAMHNKNADAPTKDTATFFKVAALVAGFNAELFPQDKIRYLGNAFEAWNKVIAKDDADWSAKQERVHVYAALQWEKMKQAKNGEYTPSDVAQYYRETQKFMDELARDPRVPVQVKVATFRMRAAFVDQVFPHKGASTVDWIKILELSPDDREALGIVASYHYKMKNFKEALPLLKRMVALKKDVSVFAEIYVSSLFQLKDYQGVLLAVREAQPRFPRNAMLTSRLARSLLELGKFDEARAANKLALELAPQDPIVQVTESLLLERDGDTQVAKKMLSSAIQAYDAAYKLDTNRPVLRRKIALLVYENRRQKNFQPTETARQEMAYVVDLLDPVKERPELGADGVEILIYAAEFGAQWKVASAACRQYEKDYGPVNTATATRSCAQAFVKTGDKTKAVELLKVGIANKKFEESRAQMQELLLKIQ